MIGKKVENYKNIWLNLDKDKNFESILDACLTDVVNVQLQTEVPNRLENFIVFSLEQDISWKSKAMFNSEEESYRENLTRISLLMEKLPLIMSSKSFSVKDSLKRLLLKSDVSINDLFECSSDVINSLLLNGHHKIAKDLRELGLIYGNNSQEKEDVINGNSDYFILDNKYLENVEILSEFLCQLNLSADQKLKYESMYVNRIYQRYGKIDVELVKLIENPNLLTRDGVAILAKAVYSLSLSIEDLEDFNISKYDKNFSNYSEIYKSHNYKNLDDIYVKNKEIATEKIPVKKDFFENIIFENNGLSINKKLKIFNYFLKKKYVKPYWYSISQKKIVLDMYIRLENTRNSELGYTKDSDFDWFNMPLKSFIVQEPEKVFSESFSNIKDNIKKEDLTIFTLTNFKRSILESVFNLNSVEEINTEKKANLFLEKLWFFNNKKYINYSSDVFEYNQRSIFNALNKVGESLYDLPLKIYSKAPHVIEISSKKNLYYQSLKIMTIDRINETLIFLSKYVGVDFLKVDILNVNEVNNLKNLLYSKIDFIGSRNENFLNFDYFSKLNIEENFTKSIKILELANQHDLVAEIFIEVEKTLDKIDKCFTIAGEISNDKDSPVNYGELSFIINLIEERYLEKLIPVNKISAKKLKF